MSADLYFAVFSSRCENAFCNALCMHLCTRLPGRSGCSDQRRRQNRNKLWSTTPIKKFGIAREVFWQLVSWAPVASKMYGSSCFLDCCSAWLASRFCWEQGCMPDWSDSVLSVLGNSRDPIRSRQPNLDENRFLQNKIGQKSQNQTRTPE